MTSGLAMTKGAMTTACHGEERSDVAIPGLLRRCTAGNDERGNDRSGARDDSGVLGMKEAF